MKVVEGSKVDKTEREGGIFIGKVEITPLLDKEMGSEEFRAAVVAFPPGVRNKFHVHTHDQILYITGGKGIVATENEERIVTVGDMILIPAGENHWHGATEDSVFLHLYVTHAEGKTTY
jgi:quercetin dioxygenase-like cupin family protein